MTDLLKDTLAEQAANAEAPELDLATIISTGDRRIRRRRTGAILGTTFVVLAVVAAGLTTARIIRDDAEPAVTPPIPFTERRPTYALGGVIHFGDTTIRTGAARIVRMVQTDVGFVYTENTGAIKLADGKTTRLLADRGDHTRLLAEGTVVGWEEKTGADNRTDEYRTIIKDLRTGEEILRVEHGDGKTSSSLPGNPDLGRILALDGGFAYFSVTGGLYRVDLAARTGRLIAASKPSIKPVTVANGRYIYVSQGPEGIGTYILIGPSLDQSVAQALQRHSGLRPTAEISTNGSFLITGEQEGFLSGVIDLKVYDETGGLYRGQPSGIQPQRFGQWLSDTTFTAIPVKGTKQPLDLVTCTVTMLGAPISCKTSFRAIAPVSALQELVLPDGRTPKDG
ncbi:MULTISPECIES: hypothetical protein [unclassified Kribbella]|uniref:hypothetical protein n=1 Tax=unclassified Kribbella TaxID=2644121 RepID=UPI00301AF4EC